MNFRIVRKMALGITLSLLGGLAMAVTNAAETPKATASAAAKAGKVKKAPVKNLETTNPKSKKQVGVKLVDINSAGKDALMKLPGVDAALAEKIIAGRPYLTKSKLLSNNVLSVDTYDKIKSAIVAKPSDASVAKYKELEGKQK